MWRESIELFSAIWISSRKWAQIPCIQNAYRMSCVINVIPLCTVRWAHQTPQLPKLWRLGTLSNHLATTPTCFRYNTTSHNKGNDRVIDQLIFEDLNRFSLQSDIGEFALVFLLLPLLIFAYVCVQKFSCFLVVLTVRLSVKLFM